MKKDISKTLAVYKGDRITHELAVNTIFDIVGRAFMIGVMIGIGVGMVMVVLL